MRLRILIGSSSVRAVFVELIPFTDDQHQPAFAYIEDGKRVAISASEYRAIRANPRQYYFSTALKVHIRCQREGVAIR
jgi:hypothetical protein